MSYVDLWLTAGEKHLVCNILLDPCIKVGLNIGCLTRFGSFCNGDCENVK